MDTAGAEESLLRAKMDLPNNILPFHLCPYHLSDFIIHIDKLKCLSLNDDKSELTEIKKRALRTGKKMINISSKAFFERTEALRLMGIYYWIIGNQKRALKWFDKSIVLGEQIHAKLELSRTYFEVGKHLLEPQSKYKSLNGLTAEKYLEKARSMFEDMNMQWDLDELDRITAYR